MLVEPGRPPRWALQPHRTALRRLVAAVPDPGIGVAPQILEAGDFALSKGCACETVLAGIATGEAVGLLPDREVGTLETWLKAHPGAQVICPDRATAYVRGRPDAIHVSDRWHLWHNLGEYAEKASLSTAAA